MIDLPRPQRDRLFLPNPPAVTYVVGDVHGQIDLFDALEAKLRADAEQVAPGEPILLVLVGDVIDRGPGSAAMLDRLVEAPKDGLQRLCLMGNHEAMFLEFLQNLDAKSAWLEYGGNATLMSYGLEPRDGMRFDYPARRLKQMLDSSVPESHFDLLKKMPVSLRLPGFLICHAGVEPSRALAEQSDDDLIWGNPSALDSAPYTMPAVTDLNAHDIKVIHGHVPQDKAKESNRRIALDTGAYATGILSAVRLAPGLPLAFVTAESGQVTDVAPMQSAVTKIT